MVQLTQHQNDIGQMLQRGNQLVSRHQLSDTEERQIEAQMRLLNQQWEELRIDAMARQTRWFYKYFILKSKFYINFI